MFSFTLITFPFFRGDANAKHKLRACVSPEVADGITAESHPNIWTLKGVKRALNQKMIQKVGMIACRKSSYGGMLKVEIIIKKIGIKNLDSFEISYIAYV